MDGNSTFVPRIPCGSLSTSPLKSHFDCTPVNKAARPFHYSSMRMNIDFKIHHQGFAILCGALSHCTQANTRWCQSPGCWLLLDSRWLLMADVFVFLNADLSPAPTVPDYHHKGIAELRCIDIASPDLLAIRCPAPGASLKWNTAKLTQCDAGHIGSATLAPHHMSLWVILMCLMRRLLSG